MYRLPGPLAAAVLLVGLTACSAKAVQGPPLAQPLTGRQSLSSAASGGLPELYVTDYGNGRIVIFGNRDLKDNDRVNKDWKKWMLRE